jgi:hypothetical protein
LESGSKESNDSDDVVVKVTADGRREGDDGSEDSEASRLNRERLSQSAFLVDDHGDHDPSDHPLLASYRDHGHGLSTLNVVDCLEDACKPEEGDDGQDSADESACDDSFSIIEEEALQYLHDPYIRVLWTRLCGTKSELKKREDAMIL